MINTTLSSSSNQHQHEDSDSQPYINVIPEDVIDYVKEILSSKDMDDFNLDIDTLLFSMNLHEYVKHISQDDQRLIAEFLIYFCNTNDNSQDEYSLYLYQQLAQKSDFDHDLNLLFIAQIFLPDDKLMDLGGIHNQGSDNNAEEHF